MHMCFCVCVCVCVKEREREYKIRKYKNESIKRGRRLNIEMKLTPMKRMHYKTMKAKKIETQNTINITVIKEVTYLA